MPSPRRCGTSGRRTGRRTAPRPSRCARRSPSRTGPAAASPGCTADPRRGRTGRARGSRSAAPGPPAAGSRARRARCAPGGRAASPSRRRRSGRARSGRRPRRTGRSWCRRRRTTHRVGTGNRARWAHDLHETCTDRRRVPPPRRPTPARRHDRSPMRSSDREPTSGSRGWLEQVVRFRCSRLARRRNSRWPGHDVTGTSRPVAVVGRVPHSAAAQHPLGADRWHRAL